MAYKFVDATQLDANLTTVANAIRTKGGTSARLSFPSGMASAISAISTGVELNFSIVGGTSAPSSPADNTIWVNTNTAITDYIFSATQPTAQWNGMVWINTGTESQVAFNALKENNIMVYPISAKQYVSGAWVAKTVKSYQGGEWVEWIPEGALYWKGNQMTSITGGWSTTGDNSDPSGGYVKGTATFNSDNIALDAVGSEATSEKRENIIVHTARTIDVSKYSSITIDVTSRSGKTNGADGFRFYGAYMALVPSVNSSSLAVDSTIKVGITGTGEFSIDLSNVSGSYAVMIQCYRAGVTFTGVYLE